MIKPPIGNFIMWLGLHEASGSYYDWVDPTRAFTRMSVAQIAGLASKWGGDWEQDTPSKAYIADASWNTFGDESITMGAWIKPETFDATWDSGDFNYRFSAIIAKAEARNDHEYIVCFDTDRRAMFRMSGGTSHSWDVVAYTMLATISNGNKYFVAGGYDAGANQVFVRVYNASGALIDSDTTGHTPGFGASPDSVPLWIGGQQQTATPSDGTHHWDGIIDEPFQYRGIFTSNEWAWMVNGGAGRQYSDLLVGGFPVWFSKIYDWLKKDGAIKSDRLIEELWKQSQRLKGLPEALPI